MALARRDPAAAAPTAARLIRRGKCGANLGGERERFWSGFASLSPFFSLSSPSLFFSRERVRALNGSGDAGVGPTREMWGPHVSGPTGGSAGQVSHHRRRCDPDTTTPLPPRFPPGGAAGRRISIGRRRIVGRGFATVPLMARGASWTPHLPPVGVGSWDNLCLFLSALRIFLLLYFFSF